MTFSTFVIAWAIVWTVWPLAVAAALFRRRLRSFRTRVQEVSDRIVTLGARVNASRPAFGQKPVADLDAAITAFAGSQLEKSRVGTVSARAFHFWEIDHGASLVTRIDGTLDMVSSMLDMRDKTLPSLLRSAADSFAVNAVRARDALFRRLDMLGKEGVPVGAERRLVELSAMAIASSTRLARTDPSAAFESFGREHWRLSEIEAHLYVRERTWRRVETDAALIERSLHLARASLATLEDTLVDVSATEPSRGLTLKRTIDRLRSLIMKVDIQLVVARRNCHPGDSAFAVPGADSDRLLDAVCASTKALSLAKVVQQTAASKCEVHAVATSRRGQA